MMYRYSVVVLSLHTLLLSEAAAVDFFETLYVPSNLGVGNTDALGRNALRSGAYKWPDARVPFVFDETYNSTDREAILAAMTGLSNRTCVEFLPKTPQHVEHIKFFKSTGCGAGIGYRHNTTTPLPVFFSDFCLRLRGAIQHELLHVLGLLHEQSRPDRDEFVRIEWANIQPQFVQNFGIADWTIVDTFGLPYDYDSLMHYPGNAFARSAERNVTIYARNDPGRVLGQSEGPTAYDLEKVRRMYDCGSD